MQIHFSNRDKFREFKRQQKEKGIERRYVDNGSNAPSGKRWAIDISAK